jgi:hypothetical protein
VTFGLKAAGLPARLGWLVGNRTSARPLGWYESGPALPGRGRSAPGACSQVVECGGSPS